LQFVDTFEAAITAVLDYRRNQATSNKPFLAWLPFGLFETVFQKYIFWPFLILKIILRPVLEKSE